MVNARTALLVASLAVVAGACAQDDVASPGAPAARAPILAAPTVSGPTEVFVVAHQDDDVLFMSPDVGRAILAPGPVATVYLTAGDAGNTDEAYYRERERGVMASYAVLAAATGAHWTEQRLSLHGHEVIVERMAEADVSLVFLRLPDGGGDGAGYASSRGTPNGSLAKLWTRAVPSLRAVDGSAVYTRDDLVDALAELYRHFRAPRINALDGTNGFGFDHSDHIHAGLFAQEAAPPDMTLRLYRGYNIQREAENLSADEMATKWAAFGEYMQHDTAICRAGHCDGKIVAGYASYATRQYLVGVEPAVVGPVGNASGLCLDLLDGRVVSTTCADVASQHFTISKRGHLGASDGLCLAGGAGGATLLPCSDGQDPDPLRWSLLSAGSFVDADGSCLLGAGERQPIIVGPCDRSPHSQWNVRFQTERSRARVAALSSVLFVADVDGDGRADLCSRSPAGLSCAMAKDAGTFDPPRVLSAAFDDESGWNDEGRAHTLRTIDIDHDGKIDVCGFTAGRVVCARGLGGGRFAPTATISRIHDFNEATDGSFTMGDLDGDGFPDACAQIGGDVRCALGDRRGGLLASTVWLPARHLTQLADVPGARWHLADIDGDGYADICRVGADGVVCATAHRHRQGFERLRRWLGPLVSPMQPESVVFGDIDGDRASDICALSDQSVVCGSSTGSSFSSFFVRVAGFPEDGSWSNGHLAMGDVDGDLRADVCRWTDADVMCALAP